VLQRAVGDDHLQQLTPSLVCQQGHAETVVTRPPPPRVWLATAVVARADRFSTSNRRDFGQQIAEIDVVYPEQLA
jgi:hypothetical protein